MFDEQTGGERRWRSPQPDIVSRLVTSGARRLFDWEPDGAVTVELPSGDQLRFGRAHGADSASLKLHTYGALSAILRRGSLGFAEACIDGSIDCADLTALFRFFLRNRDRFDVSGRGLFRTRLADRIAHLARPNSRRGSRRNVAEHYDLGNAFFRLWLDPDLNYSSGIYASGARTLEEAQAAKIERICELLDLSGGEAILEIGCGWGALARHAARRHRARMTGITLSREQFADASARAAREGLGETCRFRIEDYRDVKGSFDRIAAIEMIEAVGERYWPAFFRTLYERLTPAGSAVVQAITIDEHRFAAYRRRPDFIQRYVFPGGLLPTGSIIAHEAAAAGLRLDHVERFGQCYARTLREWLKRFDEAWPQIAALGFDERFRRLWRYYLSYCEAGFLEGAVDVGLYRLRRA